MYIYFKYIYIYIQDWQNIIIVQIFFIVFVWFLMLYTCTHLYFSQGGNWYSCSKNITKSEEYWKYCRKKKWHSCIRRRNFLCCNKKKSIEDRFFISRGIYLFWLII